MVLFEHFLRVLWTKFVNHSVCFGVIILLCVSTFFHSGHAFSSFVIILMEIWFSAWRLLCVLLFALVSWNQQFFPCAGFYGVWCHGADWYWDWCYSVCLYPETYLVSKRERENMNTNVLFGRPEPLLKGCEHIILTYYVMTLNNAAIHMHTVLI